MEFKEVVKKRRSTRRYTGKPVEVEKLREAMELALLAPSSKNTRSTRLMAVTNLEKVHALGRLRDWGSSLLEEAGAAIVVLGDENASPMWQTNASIMATVLQLALVEQGLASCWVHVGDYLTLRVGLGSFGRYLDRDSFRIGGRGRTLGKSFVGRRRRSCFIGSDRFRTGLIRTRYFIAKAVNIIASKRAEHHS